MGFSQLHKHIHIKMWSYYSFEYQLKNTSIYNFNGYSDVIFAKTLMTNITEERKDKRLYLFIEEKSTISRSYLEKLLLYLKDVHPCLFQPIVFFNYYFGN